MPFGIHIGNVLNDGANFIGGMANAWLSDNVLGAGRRDQTTEAGKVGAAFGDAAATIQGLLEFGEGAGAEAGGLLLDATGIGAIAGVPINIAAAGVMVHGAAVGITGASHLAMSVANSIPSGGGEAAPTPGGGGVTEPVTNVEIVDAKGSPLGEFDEINKNGFVEDKSARGLDTPNPRTGQPVQTPQDWARKQIFDKTSTRIENLKDAVASRPAGGSTTVPSIGQIKNIRNLEFRIEAATPEVRSAVEQQLAALRSKYPDWTFSATFGN